MRDHTQDAALSSLYSEQFYPTSRGGRAAHERRTRLLSSNSSCTTHACGSIPPSIQILRRASGTSHGKTRGYKRAFEHLDIHKRVRTQSAGTSATCERAGGSRRQCAMNTPASTCPADTCVGVCAAASGDTIAQTPCPYPHHSQDGPPPSSVRHAPHRDSDRDRNRDRDRDRNRNRDRDRDRKRLCVPTWGARGGTCARHAR